MQNKIEGPTLKAMPRNSSSRTKKLISFVIPVYRNEHSITPTYEKIRHLFESKLREFDFEMLFVDDGSDDHSLKVLVGLHNKDPRVRVVSFTRNFGQFAAIVVGFRHITGDAVVMVSADLQDPLELIVQMVTHWSQGAELAICHRTNREDGFFPKLFSRLAYSVIRVSFPTIPAGGFDYFLMDQKVVEAYNQIEVRVRNRFLQGELLWYGFKTTYIPYKRTPRAIGKTKYHFKRKLRIFLDYFLFSSAIPIRTMSFLGFFTATLGFFQALTVVYARFLDKTPFPGWAPIVILILLIGGILMVMLGVIGEYIWRIYDEVRKKPDYVVSRIY